MESKSGKQIQPYEVLVEKNQGSKSCSFEALVENKSDEQIQLIGYFIFLCSRNSKTDFLLLFTLENKSIKFISNRSLHLLKQVAK